LSGNGIKIGGNYCTVLYSVLYKNFKYGFYNTNTSQTYIRQCTIAGNNIGVYGTVFYLIGCIINRNTSYGAYCTLSYGGAATQCIITDRTYQITNLTSTYVDRIIAASYSGVNIGVNVGYNFTPHFSTADIVSPQPINF